MTSAGKLTSVLLALTASFMVITSLNFLTDGDVRLLTEDDLPYEEPLGLGHSTTMLLGIFTNEYEYEERRRRRIRDTYLKEKGRDPRICKLSEYITQREQSLEGGNAVVCQIPYVFVVGGNPDGPTDHSDDNAALAIPREEAKRPLTDDKFGDTIYLNIKENDHEGKSASYFKWAHSLTETYKIDYISKVASTTLIDVNQMIKVLNLDLAPAPFNRRVYGGDTWGSYKDNIVYAHGAFYFLSADLAAFVGGYLQPSERDEFGSKKDEATDIGIFVYKHPKPIKFLFLSQNVFWYPALDTKDTWYDHWNNKMGELPTKGPLVPFHGICHEMIENGDYVSTK